MNLKIIKAKIFPNEEEWNALVGKIHNLAWIKFTIYTNRRVSKNYSLDEKKIRLWGLKWKFGEFKGFYRYFVLLRSFDTYFLEEIEKRLDAALRYLELTKTSQFEAISGSRILLITTEAKASFLLHLKDESRDTIRDKIKNSKGFLTPRILPRRKGKKDVSARIGVGQRVNRYSIQSNRQQITSRFNKLPEMYDKMLQIFKSANIEDESRIFGDYLLRINAKKRKTSFSLVSTRMQYVLVSLAERDKSQRELAEELKTYCDYFQTRYAIDLLEMKRPYRSINTKLIETERVKRNKGKVGCPERICTLTEAGKVVVEKINQQVELNKIQQSWVSLGSVDAEDLISAHDEYLREEFGEDYESREIT